MEFSIKNSATTSAYFLTMLRKQLSHLWKLTVLSTVEKRLEISPKPFLSRE